MKIIPIQPFAIPDNSIISTSISMVKQDQLPLVEMFSGIEGEGSYVGERRILLRVGGCRVKCMGCDSSNTWGLKTSKFMYLKNVEYELFDLISKEKVQTVAITGGEPLHYPTQMLQLASALRANGTRSWLETSGLILDEQVFSAFDFVSIDVKTPSSGPAAFTPESVTKFKQFFADKHFTGQVKMIVTNQSDADWILENFSDWLNTSSPFKNPIVITPACGKGYTSLEAKLQAVKERVLICQNTFKGNSVRIIVQQHALLDLR